MPHAHLIEILRFNNCGSVDDGRLILEDQIKIFGAPCQGCSDGPRHHREK